MSSPDPAAPTPSTADDVLVLVGPMGAGKTSVGRRVAKALGLRFVDTDKVIAAAHGTIPEIFATHGEAQFRAWEAEAVAEAITRGGVVSLGGGAVVTPATRDLLRTVPVAHLTVSTEAVAARIADTTRPLLAGDDPVAAWSRIADARRGWYDEVADETFDTSRTPMQRVAEQVVNWMRGRE